MATEPVENGQSFQVDGCPREVSSSCPIQTCGRASHSPRPAHDVTSWAPVVCKTCQNKRLIRHPWCNSSHLLEDKFLPSRRDRQVVVSAFHLSVNQDVLVNGCHGKNGWLPPLSGDLRDRHLQSARICHSQSEHRPVWNFETWCYFWLAQTSIRFLNQNLHANTVSLAATGTRASFYINVGSWGTISMEPFYVFCFSSTSPECCSTATLRKRFETKKQNHLSVGVSEWFLYWGNWSFDKFWLHTSLNPTHSEYGYR